MPGFVPGIRVLEFQARKDVDGLDEPGHDRPAMTEQGVSIKTQTALEHDPENREPVYRLFRPAPGSPYHARQVFH
jgi:hypothetical protein